MGKPETEAGQSYYLTWLAYGKRANFKIHCLACGKIFRFYGVGRKADFDRLATSVKELIKDKVGDCCQDNLAVSVCVGGVFGNLPEYGLKYQSA